MNSIHEKLSVLYYSQCCESTLSVSVWLIPASLPSFSFFFLPALLLLPCKGGGGCTLLHYTPLPPNHNPNPPHHRITYPYGTKYHVIISCKSHVCYFALVCFCAPAALRRTEADINAVSLTDLTIESILRIQRSPIFHLEIKGKLNHFVKHSFLISLHWSTSLKPWLTVNPWKKLHT